MKNIKAQATIALLILSLTGCGKTEVLLPYNQEANGYGQYSGISLSKLDANHPTQEPTYPMEDPTDPVETPPTIHTLKGNYMTFDDGAVGLLCEVSRDKYTELPSVLTTAEYEPLAPGGLTKVLTGYVAANSIKKDQLAFYSSFRSGLENTSNSNILDQSLVTKDQLMSAMYAINANDAAIALVFGAKDSETEFITAMNEATLELGATHSNFVNATGIDQEGAYTTIFDMYLIADAAMKNDLVFSKVCSKGAEGTYTSIDESIVYDYQYCSANEFMNDLFLLEGMETLGGLQCQTEKSGYCNLYYFMDQSNNRYIGIVMNSTTYSGSYDDMRKLIVSTF